MAADKGLIESVGKAYRSMNTTTDISPISGAVVSAVKDIASAIAAKKEEKKKQDAKDRARAEAASDTFTNMLAKDGSKVKTKQGLALLGSWGSSNRGQYLKINKLQKDLDVGSEEYQSYEQQKLDIINGSGAIGGDLAEWEEEMTRLATMEMDSFTNANTTPSINAMEDMRLGKYELVKSSDNNNSFDVVYDGKTYTQDEFEDLMPKSKNPAVIKQMAALNEYALNEGKKGIEFNEVDIESKISASRNNFDDPSESERTALASFLTDDYLGASVDFSEKSYLGEVLMGHEIVEGEPGYGMSVEDAQKEALDYLYGDTTRNKDEQGVLTGGGYENGQLYRAMKNMHTKAYEPHQNKIDENNRIAEAAAKASGGKGKESESAFKDRKSYEGIKSLGNRIVENTMEGTQSSYYSRLKALEQKGGIGKPDENNPHYKEMKNLENDLRKVIGGIQGEQLELSYNVFGDGKYEISNTSAGKGTYTLDELFSEDDTNPSNLLWAFNRN
tara:strand:- start:6029 stop:7531 length:1503 start_codon:yes stop_codon:yes gene_type:complete